jgi:trehalose/maltose hydrolase-like predicted phosphorylase
VYKRQVLSLAPALPAHWKEMVFRLQFRGTNYRFLIRHDIAEVNVDQNAEIIFRNNRITLDAGLNQLP